MLQTIITILIVAATLAWVGRYVWRFWHPASKTGCAGGCCSGGDAPQVSAAPRETPRRAVMVSSDDLRARVKARRA